MKWNEYGTRRRDVIQLILVGVVRTNDLFQFLRSRRMAKLIMTTRYWVAARVGRRYGL